MLIAEPTTIDLGSVKFGQAYRLTYTLKNETDKPIRVDNIAVSCNSCTVASMRKRLILPKSSEEVNVTFTPGSVTKHKKSVHIMYNNTSLDLKFTAESHE